MRVFVLGTGSSGNALIVEADGTRLWVDAGIGPRAASMRLRALGHDLFPRGVDGVVVTHDHGDHAAQLESVAKALQLPKRDHGDARIHLHEGISAHRVRTRFETARFPATGSVQIGALTVEALPIAHDAPQVALRVTGGGVSFGYVTDLGSTSSALAAFLGGCDTILLESNYCPRMLAAGPYPQRLKQRISSHTGHLSNEQTAALVGEIGGRGRPHVVLCHLSKVNNDPARARAVVSEACTWNRLGVLEHGEARELSVVRTRERAAQQLSLRF